MKRGKTPDSSTSLSTVSNCIRWQIDHYYYDMFSDMVSQCGWLHLSVVNIFNISLQDQIFSLFLFFTYSILCPSLVPPSIADEPTELVVTRLSPVVIACTASGVPVPTIHWSKDGMKLPKEGQGYSVLPTGQTHNSAKCIKKFTNCPKRLLNR